MSGSDFEIAVKDIYKKQGFVASLTPTTGDYGVDVIAQSHDKKIAIQAKRYSNSVGVKAVQEAYSGALYYKATHAVVITNSVFTKNAINLARTLKVELIDKWKLAKIWLEAFPIQEIPIFDENHYQSIEPEITELIGRSLYDTEQIYMAKLLAAKKMNVGLTTWLYDLYSYTNNTRSMH